MYISRLPITIFILPPSLPFLTSRALHYPAVSHVGWPLTGTTSLTLPLLVLAQIQYAPLPHFTHGDFISPECWHGRSLAEHLPPINIYCAALPGIFDSPLPPGGHQIPPLTGVDGTHRGLGWEDGSQKGCYLPCYCFPTIVNLSFSAVMDLLFEMSLRAAGSMLHEI